MRAIVTVKLPRNPEHDPSNKKTGKCPLFTEKYQGIELQGSFVCTDVTGSYHSYIEHGKDKQEIVSNVKRKFGQDIHITRIEWSY